MGINDTSVWYQQLDVKPFINGRGHVTALGGSLMPPEVVAAMADAARQFVDIHDLLVAAGRRIADLIGVPGAFIANGAAACLVVAGAAAVAGDDPVRARRLPHVDWGRDQFITPRAHRFGYDQAYELTGGRFVEVGDAGGATLDEMAAAISARTAAILLLANPARPMRCTREEVAALAHRHGLPLIVDAASELPPATNLRRFVDEGADMVIFSGGKGLHGPQCGLILCRTAEWVRACAVNAAPNATAGRPLKVGKEEIVGLVAAVERYVNLDHAAEEARLRAVCAEVLAAVAGLPGVDARPAAGLAGVPGVLCPPGGHPLPIAIFRFDPAVTGIDAGQVEERLRTGEPGIRLLLKDDELWLNPQTVYDGEAAIIAARLRAVLTEARAAQPAVAP